MQTELAVRVFKTKEGTDWLREHSVEFFNTDAGKELIRNEEFHEMLCQLQWLDTPNGRSILSEVFQTETGRELAKNEKFCETLCKWLKISWYKSVPGEAWIRIFQTEAGKELVKHEKFCERFCQWLSTFHGRNFLDERAVKFFQTGAGRELAKNENFCKTFCKWLDTAWWTPISWIKSWIRIFESRSRERAS